MIRNNGNARLPSQRSWVRKISLFAFAVTTTLCSQSATTNAETVRGGAGAEATNHDENAERRRLERREQGGAAIAILVPAMEEDIHNCCLALKSLRFLQGDVDRLPEDKAPVLLFNEGDLTLNQMKTLEDCTDRTVAFPIARLRDQFPVGFGDETEEWKKFLDLHDVPSLGRPPYFSYANMIAFWTRWIWEHPAVQQFDTVMRMDTDSCFLKSVMDNPAMNRLPYLDEQYVYQSIAPEGGMGRHYFDRKSGQWTGKQHKANVPDLENNPNCKHRNKQDYIVGLYDYTLDYMDRERLTPANEGIWGATKSGWEQFCSLQTFQTNFEVVRKDFFLSKEVRRWHRALVGAHPFGTYRFRWGDAQTRFLTMGMFAPEGSVLSVPIDGYAHGKDYNAEGHPYKCRTADGEGMFA